MFTGIIEEIGTVRSVRGSGTGVKIDIEAVKVLEGTKTGDSIAVNGVCLTVTPGEGHFTADAMPETLRRTSLGRLRFGGHIVAGHVDACGEILSMPEDGIATVLKISAPREILKYVAVKGSVTVDGVSLTVTGAGTDSIEVSLIPHTAQHTTLGLLRPGHRVNLEADLLARYVERLLGFPGTGQEGNASSGGLTLEFLAENGF